MTMEVLVAFYFKEQERGCEILVQFPKLYPWERHLMLFPILGQAVYSL